MRRTRRFWIPVLLTVLVLGVFAWVRRDWLIARAYILILEWDWRVKRLQVDRVTGVLGVLPGQKVADLGTGSGLFARSLAKEVGADGVVYAVDISEELLDYVEESASELGLNNIRTVLATPDDPCLPEAVDLIFICDTLHHIGERAQYLKRIRSYLRPSGRLAIIDFIKSPHLLSSSKYPLTALEKWLEEAGYQPAGRYTFLQDSFFVIYECPTCPAPIP